MRFSFVIFFFCLISFSCEKQFGNRQFEAPQKIIDNSIELFPGKLIEQSSDILDEVQVWKIKIENESGSVVSFYWQKNYNLLFVIEGEHGPFNYEMIPPLGVLVLSTAKFLAFESYSEKVLTSWKLKRNNSYRNRWVYLFNLKQTELPIMIDAVSGDVL